ncbi:MAG: response regulator [Nitrososphaeraceae archaeon]|jgi:CheY-like chemotaxis protein
MTKIKENNTCNTNNNNDGNKKRIMIVDDEPDVISVLKIVLEENGFEVDSFIDPIAALKNYRTGLYDLLILDIKMPKMDGFELHDEIKKIDDKAKVCFLTASEMYYKKSRREKYCSLDKDLFIQKPIANEDLVAELNKMLTS